MVAADCSLVGRRLAAFLVVCIFAAGVSACSDTTGVPTSSDTTGVPTSNDIMGVRTSNVQVLLLTGAPSDMISSAGVWISHVYLQGRVGEPEGKWGNLVGWRSRDRRRRRRRNGEEVLESGEFLVID